MLSKPKKIPKKKRAKKTARQIAMARAIKYCSLYIRARDGKCVTCESEDNLQNGHLITCAKMATRFSKVNCNCQCRSCNNLHEYQPEHYTKWFIDTYGVDEYDKLYRLSNTPVKITTPELVEIGDNFKREYEELING